MKGRQFGELQRMTMVRPSGGRRGSSNVEDFFKYMGQFAWLAGRVRLLPGAHGQREEAAGRHNQHDQDAFRAWRSSQANPGLVFNKVQIDDADDLPQTFSAVFGFHKLEKKFTTPTLTR